MSETAEFHPGDRVWIHHDSAYDVIQHALVPEARADNGLRLEFADGHRQSLRDGHVELSHHRANRRG
ncbi:hypothetical protein ACFVHB_11970 [Kitasatospora sp. NPDC127111]|uniref:hypothetical protein n=1 Tax=Kitasatospora sp. NPDC127111 TaxID=3345363 RepID=UPI003629D9ED